MSGGGVSRRRFLAVAGTAVAATAAGAGGLLLTDGTSTRLTSSSGAVTAAEARRRRAGAGVTEVTLVAAALDLSLGAVTVPTWAYGSVPGPEIQLRAGDVLKARVRNSLAVPTSVHWHGIALRNDMDGVPGLTQEPIAPAGEFVYEFTAPDPGTHMYHSHSVVQLDRGLYGALIVEDPSEPGAYDAEHTIVIDDWLDGLDGTPDETLATLRRGMAGGGMPGHSMGGGHGMGGMGGMAGGLGADAGDVQYPTYLINGRPPTDPGGIDARPGERLRLRLVNIGSDRPFRVAVGGHRLTVTHTDGFPVEPVTVDAVLLGMGERYDVVVTAGDGVFPIVAVPEGAHTGALAFLRTAAGELPAADVRPAELDRRVLRTEDLRATAASSLRDRPADRVLAVRLEGDMQGYRWMLNGRRFDPADPWAGALDLREGERVRLSFENATMMFHPMHLHGHTFQLRGRRLDGARKDTVIVRPMEMVTAEFDAANPGQWVLHCHNAYHAESGMTAVMSYVT